MSSPVVVRLPSAAVRQPDRRHRLARTRFARYVTPLVGLVLVASAFLGAAPVSAAQGPVELGTAGSFAVLAGSGMTNTGPTTINGDIGTFPTLSQTGLGSITLTGTNHAGDAVTQGAKDALVTAYNDAAGRNPVTNVPVELGGTRLVAGVYTSPTLGLTGTLTLDAEGSADAMFIFQAGSTLIAESNSRVLLINGANPCNVVWQVGSSATFKTGTQFVGDVLAMQSITAQTAATFQGRLLARIGAVTLDTNTITNGACTADDGGTTTSTTLAPTSTTTPTTPTTATPTTTTPTITPTTTGTTPTTVAVPPTGSPVETASIPGSGTPVNRTSLGLPAPGPQAGPPAQTATGTPDQTSSGQPGVPLRSTPTTPPARTSLPATGGPIVELLAAGLALVVLGATSVVAGRNRRDAVSTLTS